MNRPGGPPSGIAFESKRLYAAADTLGRSVAGRVADWDRDHGLDRGVFVEAAAAGLTGIEVPKYLGGLGLGFQQKVKAAEILGRHSMALAFSIVNTQNVAARLAEIGSPSHKRDLIPELLAGNRIGSTALTEPTAGSDFGAIATFAQPMGGHWLLTGEKAWITNAAVSDVIICYAQTDPDAGNRGIASFLIDGSRPGFQRLPPYRLSGSHIIGTGGFRLDNYRAEAEDLLTEPGEGFKTALAGVNGARIYVAALCCAMVHSALVTAVQYGAERRAFGRTLLDHQGLAWSLASVATKYEAARLLTDRAIELMEAGDTDGIVLAAAHAKKFATEMAEPAIAACIQAMGAEGLRDHHPLGRHLADARVANFVDGSTEIQTDRIARSLAEVYGHETHEAPALQPEPAPAEQRTGPPTPPPPRPSDARTPEPPPPPADWPAEPLGLEYDHPEPDRPADDLMPSATEPRQAVPPLFPSAERDEDQLQNLPPPTPSGAPTPPIPSWFDPPADQLVFDEQPTAEIEIEIEGNGDDVPVEGGPPLPPDSLRTDRS